MDEFGYNVPPGIYQHNNNEYIIVIGTVRHGVTHENMLYYRDLFGKHGRYVRSIRDMVQDKREQYIGHVPDQHILHRVDTKRLTDRLDKSGCPDSEERCHILSKQDIPFGMYRDYKGRYVIVYGMAKEYKTKKQMVLYHSLDLSNVTAMPLSVFLSTVDKDKHPEAIQEQYFKPWALAQKRRNT